MSEESMKKLLAIDKDEWVKETTNIDEFFKKFGSNLPKEIATEHTALKKRLEPNK